MIEYTDDSIHIYDENHNEIVMWNELEWIEEPQLVFSIANAIEIFYSKGSDGLKNILGVKT